ncbi:MAG: histidine--tRNA ligase [Planctomycetes bacterium]|nr:histidine--tRNA ligase [Planctomycetota bacterium]
MSVQARLFQGTRDILPEELLPRQELVAALTRTFESYGFAPLETPAMEFLDILLGKYGDEGDKLLYKLAYKGGEVLALRYDLTVPLSRVVAMNPELPLPFKRYQIQPVWRGDRPQPAQGRYREFIQCDVDTVGSASMAADAENVAVVDAGIRALGLTEFVVRINHRRLLRGLVEAAGLNASQEASVLRSVDKLDKIGMEGVQAELTAGGIAADAQRALLELMDISGSPEEVLRNVETRVGGSEAALQGIRELRELLEYSAALGVDPARVSVDLHLTRGLDYYTGPVYEVALTSIEKFGSLGGGGRYDDLMSLYGGAPIPATGVSIGLSRVLSALLKLGKLTMRSSPANALVMRMPDAAATEGLKLCTELRTAGVACELYYDADRLKKQFLFAERKGIPCAVILGGNEIAAGTVTLKHLPTGVQETLPRAALAARIQVLTQR